MREDDYDKLKEKMKTRGLLSNEYESGRSTQALDWYLDLRRNGSIPHSGFGLGFERLVMLVTGMNNIRDTLPYPRCYKDMMF